MKLLDLDSLMPDGGAPAGEKIPDYPGPNSIPNASTGYHKPSNGRPCGDGIPTIPIIPVENAWVGVEAARKPRISPAAIALVIAWCERKGVDSATQIEALQSLEAHTPCEQVAIWSQACESVGVKPWRVWHMESPGHGEECTACQHFGSFADSVEGTRRRFFWRCNLGYPVYELWRWSGLMLIAPPDCTRYERHTIPERSW